MNDNDHKPQLIETANDNSAIPDANESSNKQQTSDDNQIDYHLVILIALRHNK
jgi:hypothetical protein